MRLRLLGLLAVFGLAAWAEKYSGPRPPKPDIPYLLHASTLVETDVGEAQESKVKDDLLYSVRGTTSQARTPLPEPILIVDAQKLIPDRLSLYKMEVKNGQRQLQIGSGRRSKGAKPIFLMVNKLEGSLFRVEVNEYLENGEYCLSPEGSNQVFCFTTY